MSTNMSKTMAAFGAAAILGLTGCEPPPHDVEQIGYRGVAMEQVIDRDAAAAKGAQMPPAPQPPAPDVGPRAGDIYQNVQVLGDLNVAQFTRLMLAITQWVSPEEGCAYCHVGENYASDDIYTKVVSRNMLKMTKHINGEWTDHVAETGVTCYTCHRGNAVPQYIWFEQPPGDSAGGFTARNYTHNMANPETGLSSLPADVFSRYLDQSPDGIRVIADTALPQPGEPGASIQMTEQSYGLMMHMSTSLGVNCTFCHNSRAFSQWDESTPQRITSWYGIRMVESLNDEWLTPLQPVYPDKRLGPNGDAPKANCSTCHQGVNKPLNGISMLPDYPSLAGD